ncbi:MAG: carboxy-S-adenosyl-L-methionine synthase CmoA [Proteobacteria bacterium]|nr:carboxy-S-adenosyl-L-methionine synthase CmoA [Pseudomonadota bacterium]
MKDKLFNSDSVAGKFRFDESVAEVFDDMLARSIPYYSDMQRMITTLAQKHYQEGSRIYDLGCSTGTTILNLSARIKSDRLKIIGIDSSQPVIERARLKLDDAGLANAELVCKDVMEAEIKNASVVIMNYTLQFIPPDKRHDLLKKIYEGLLQGGILLLSEKVLEESSQATELFIEEYYDFKRIMGYSELEISRKREALDDVLIPFTTKEESALLGGAGFEASSIFFKCYNFASFIAFKGSGK